MEATLNSHPVLVADITEQRVGPWYGRVELDLEEGEVSGSVELVAGGETWRGFVERGRVESGRWLGELVGGRGGLERAVPAQYYVGSSYVALVADILSACGEQLDDAEHQPAALAGTAERWQRVAGSARAALNAVAKATGTTWRVTREGGVAFVANETWSKLDYDYAEQRGDPSSSTVVTSPAEAPMARPGRTLGGHKVAAVQTLIRSGGTEQVITTGETDGSSDGALLRELVRRTVRNEVDYSQIYPAKVIAQDADGTVHLMPDDDRVRGSGLTKVPLRHGLPGLTVKVRPGERAALFFEDGDPQKPACGLWPDGSSVLSVEWDLESFAVGKGASEPWVLGQALYQWLSQMTVNTAMGPSSPPVNIATFQQLVLSKRHTVDG